MRKLCCLYLFALSGIPSCAQVNILKESHFFAQPMTYGRELRDLEGRPVARKQDTLYFIYLEVSGQKEPQITSVHYNGRVFKAAVYPVNEEAVHVGFVHSGEEIVIKRQPAHTFIKIELTEDTNSKAERSGPKSRLLNGFINSQRFRWPLKEISFLAGSIRG